MQDLSGGTITLIQMRKMLIARDKYFEEKQRHLDDLDEAMEGLITPRIGGVAYGIKTVGAASHQAMLVPSVQDSYEDPEAVLAADDKRKLAKDLANTVDQRQHLFHR